LPIPTIWHLALALVIDGPYYRTTRKKGSVGSVADAARMATKQLSPTLDNAPDRHRRDPFQSCLIFFRENRQRQFARRSQGYRSDKRHLRIANRPPRLRALEPK
jgi:hypothetical protein